MLCHTSLFIACSFSHVIFYKKFTSSHHLYTCTCIYIIIRYYKTFMSILVFCKISKSILQFLWDLDVPFYSFYQGSHWILQLFKWPCHTSFLPMWNPVHSFYLPVFQVLVASILLTDPDSSQPATPGFLQYLLGIPVIGRVQNQFKKMCHALDALLSPQGQSHLVEFNKSWSS